MKIWAFESIHCLNLNMQCQKRYDVTNGVKVNFLICAFVRCKINMLFLAYILFIILSMSAVEFAEKLTLVHFWLKFA